MFVGISDDVKYYFPDNEPLWFIGDSLSERKELNDSLNRESIKIDDIDQLLVNVELALVNGEPRASLVIMKNIPLEMEKNLSTLVNALNIMKYVKVYEIDRDPIFKYGQYVPSLYKLKELSFDKTRSENIKIYSNPTDKQTEILQSLEFDLNVSRDNEKKLKNVLEQTVLEKAKLEKRISELEFDVDEKYLYKIERLTEQIEELETNLSNLQINFDTERNKTTEYLADVQEKTAKVSELQYEIKAYDQRNEQKDLRIEQYKRDISKLKEDIQKLETERTRLLATSVDEESIVILNSRLTEEVENVQVLLSEIDSLKIDIKNKEYEIKNLQNALVEMRNGKQELNSYGRSFTLDKARLKSANLIYIKVFEEIPYMKQYIDFLFKVLSKSREERGKSVMLVLKNDEGLDNLIFKDFEVISNLNEISRDKYMFRLYPSSTMFSGIETLDNNFDFVFVIDYIKSSEYYLRSSAIETILTSVSHSKKIRDFGLEGLPISLDTDSTVRIRYDSTISSRVLKSSRDVAVLSAVTDWYNLLATKGGWK